ncbi:MAG: hypothetical protein JO303_15700, partial [Caulobacteraceae bacterium]|nr:hypothetical protein [Caulobacteraceae bacterium]
MDDPFEALLLAAQSGPLDDPPWRAFVSDLRRALGGNFANLIFRRAGAAPSEGIMVRDPAPLSDRLRPLYAERFFAADPIPYFEMTPG